MYYIICSKFEVDAFYATKVLNFAIYRLQNWIYFREKY